MFPFNILRKLGSLLRGSARTPQIVASVALGMTAGFVAGANLWTALFILAALVFNINFFLFLAFWAIGEGVAIAITPVTFNVGWGLLAVPPIEGAVRFLVNAPVTALLGLERYVVLGGLPVGIALGLGIGALVAWLVSSLRRKLEAVQSSSEKWERFKQRRVVRIFTWVLFGKKVDPEDFSPRIIRRSGAAVLGAGVAIMAVVAIFVVPPAAEWGMETGLARVNGATVEVENVDLSPFAGRMYIRGFQMANAQDLDQNVTEFREMGAKLSIAELLRGRVVIDEAVIDRARLSERRKTPAKPYPAEKPPAEEKKPAPEPPEEGKPLEKYLKKAENIKKRIKQVQYYWERLKSLREGADKSTKKEAEKRADRWGYSSLSADYLVEKVPSFMLRDLKIKNMAVSDAVAPLTARIQGLSNNPRLMNSPVKAHVEQTEGEAFGDLQLALHKEGAPMDIRFNIPGIPVKKMSGQMSEDMPVNLQEGTLHVKCDGTVDGEGRANLPLKIAASGLTAGSSGGQKAGGMSGDVLARVLSSTDTLNLTVVLYGPLSSMRARVESDELMAQLKEAAKDVAKEKVKDEVKKRAGEMLDKKGGGEVRDRVQDGIKGLFGGGDDEEKD